MIFVIKADRKSYGEVWLGAMKLVSDNHFNVPLVENLLKSLGYRVSFEELI